MRLWGGENETLSGNRGVKDERGADELSPTTKIRHHDVPPTEWDGPATSPSKWHVGRSLEGSCPLSLGLMPLRGLLTPGSRLMLPGLPLCLFPRALCDRAQMELCFSEEPQA